MYWFSFELFKIVQMQTECSTGDWNKSNTCSSSNGIGDGKLKLAKMYQDHMVFQRTPNNPKIWGFGTAGKSVKVIVFDSDGKDVSKNTGNVFVEDNEEFEIGLGSYEAGTGYTVVIKEDFGNNEYLEATLVDVAFGDVWICSGQSNMEQPIKDVRNSSEEIDKSVGYGNIRLLKTARQVSKTPLKEPIAFQNNWSKPRKEFLDNGGFGFGFSAVCLIFGEQLYDELNVPIGLIESSWGGTIIEAWSPPDSLEYCGINDTGTDDENNHNEYLWNAMIHPYLRFSIKGAIWYQGEQNAGYSRLQEYEGHNRERYTCTFPKMIDGWRKHWAQQTKGDVDRNFPFGFVQLAPFTNQRDHLAWPELRWRQTAGYGFAPNEEMENVFMATAVDSDIDLHPVNKRLPATRLGWAAANLVYGNTTAPIRGPHPEKVSFKTTDRKKIVISFDKEIENVLVEADRFMVCCSIHLEECDKVPYGQGWEGITIIGNVDTNAIELDASKASCSSNYSGIGYLWLETPCSEELACPIYSKDSYRLPAAPWKTVVQNSFCALNVAYTGDSIQILETGESFLITESQEACHKECLAHAECNYYAWYHSLSQNNPKKCHLRKNQKEQVTEEYMQYGSKTCSAFTRSLD